LEVSAQVIRIQFGETGRDNRVHSKERKQDQGRRFGSNLVNPHVLDILHKKANHEQVRLAEQEQEASDEKHRKCSANPVSRIVPGCSVVKGIGQVAPKRPALC